MDIWRCWRISEQGGDHLVQMPIQSRFQISPIQSRWLRIIRSKPIQPTWHIDPSFPWGHTYLGGISIISVVEVQYLNIITPIISNTLTVTNAHSIKKNYRLTWTFVKINAMLMVLGSTWPPISEPDLNIFGTRENHILWIKKSPDLLVKEGFNGIQLEGSHQWWVLNDKGARYTEK